MLPQILSLEIKYLQNVIILHSAETHVPTMLYQLLISSFGNTAIKKYGTKKLSKSKIEVVVV